MRLPRSAIAAAAAAASLLAGAGPAAANPSIPGSTSGDGMIYLPLYHDGAVQVVDPVANRVVKTIPGAGDHPIVLKSTLDHKKIYSGNFGPFTAEIGVIDTATGTVVKKIPTLGAPYAVSSLSPDGRYLYAPTILSVVEVIDTVTDTVVRTLPVAVPPGPAHMEVSLDNKVLYIMSGLGTVTKYDALTGAVLSPPLFLNGLAPGWGALSADGATLYAVNYLGGVTFIDTASWTVTRTVAFRGDAAPLSGTLTPDGSQLWVCSLGTSEITVLDARTGAVLRTIPTVEAPAYVGFSADGTRAWVSMLSGETAGLPPDAGILRIGLSYTAPRSPGYLDTYDTATGTRIARLQVGDAPLAGVYPR